MEPESATVCPSGALGRARSRVGKKAGSARASGVWRECSSALPSEPNEARLASGRSPDLRFSEFRLAFPGLTPQWLSTDRRDSPRLQLRGSDGFAPSSQHQIKERVSGSEAEVKFRFPVVVATAATRKAELRRATQSPFPPSERLSYNFQGWTCIARAIPRMFPPSHDVFGTKDFAARANRATEGHGDVLRCMTDRFS